MSSDSAAIISASLLAADLANTGREAKLMLEAGVDGIHFDVMDFNFVPNLTFGPGMCKALRDFGINACIDVHLMVQQPEKYVTAFAEAGADYLLFHPEAAASAKDLIKDIRQAGMHPGLVYSPETDINTASSLWTDIDALLIMTVQPGFGGQNLLEECLDKVAIAKEILIENKLTPRLGVDGGIKASNIAQAKAAGANWFIAGSSLYKANKSYPEAVSALRQQIALAENPKKD